MPREFASFDRELAQVEAKGRTLTGYASVFNFPIDSGAFGHNQTTFVRPGAFTQTLKRHSDRVQVLVNHGMDPRWGLTPVATIKEMEQDNHGLRVAADIIDHPEYDPLVANLKAGGLRAMSIQFETVKEDFNDDRTERNLREVGLWEFGPVTFPANAAAVASLHSLQEFVPDLNQMAAEPTTKEGMAAHLRSAHGVSEAEMADMSLAEKRAMHRRMHANGADHEHEDMMATNQVESSSPGSRPNGTPDSSRLTWERQLRRKLELEDEELAAMAARMDRLRR